MDKPLLSVCLITYNQSKYIRNSIESVLKQEVDYPWEIIIADDFSVDGTREIVLDYKKRYPQLITLVLQEKNVGPAKNFLDLVSASRSQYIAYLEGDDYWIDTRKLQKQVEFMVNHPDCALVFHAVKIISGVDEVIISEHNYDSSGGYINKSTADHFVDPEVLIINGGSFVSSPSMMFRGDVLRNLPHWYANAHAGDYPLILLSLSLGEVYFMNQVMAVYRKLVPGSVVSENIKQSAEFKIGVYENLVDTLVEFNIYTANRFDGFVKRRISDALYGFLLSDAVSYAQKFKAYRIFKNHLLPEHRKLISLLLFPVLRPMYMFVAVANKIFWLITKSRESKYDREK